MGAVTTREVNYAKGEEHYLAKLSEDAVRFIRSCEIGVRALARRFEVDPTTIRDVRSRRTWRHVEGRKQ
jgi:hypothetical protein